jgi:hypothetical protein
MFLNIFYIICADKTFIRERECTLDISGLDDICWLSLEMELEVVKPML